MTEHRPPWSGWATAAALSLVHLCAFRDRYLIALVAPGVKRSLGVSDFQIGLLQGTAFVLIYAVGTLLVGPFAERARKTTLVAASVAAWSLAAALCAVAETFNQMFASRLALGLGQAGLSPAALAMIAVAMPRGQISRGVAVYTSGSTLGRSAAMLGGAALLPLLATAAPFAGLGVSEDWRSLLLFSSLTNLMLIAVILTLPERAARPARRRGAWKGWLARKAPAYALHIGAAGAGTLAIQATTAWTTTILMRRDGFSIETAGAAFGLIVLAFAPAGHLSGGYLLDKIRPKFRNRAPAVGLAISLSAALPAAAVFCFYPTVTGSLVGLGALTYVLGIATPTAFSGVQTMTPRNMRARANAFFLCCNTLIGFGLGPPLVGLLNDRAFGEAAPHVSLFVTLLAASAFGTACCAIRIAQPR